MPASYDDWKTTDPADADPDREDRCTGCGCVECECERERDRNEDDGLTYADPRDYRDGLE